MGKQNRCSERRQRHTVDENEAFNPTENVNVLCTRCADVNSDVIHDVITAKAAHILQERALCRQQEQN